MKDINKELHVLLDIQWHEPVEFLNNSNGKYAWRCSCGETYTVYSSHYHDNLDFSSDPGKITLLREMVKHKIACRFAAKINGLSLDEDGDLIDNCIPIDFLTDTTGKLALLARDFLKRGKS